MADAKKGIKVALTRSNNRADESVDRISELPDYIINLILSSEGISAKDIACMHVLSKRWRTFCFCGPVLSINQRLYVKQIIQRTPKEIREGGPMFKVNNDQFITSTDNSLKTYVDQSSSVAKFKLKIFSFSSDLAPHIDRWVDFATNSKVEELILRLSSRKLPFSRQYHFPRSILVAETITRLTVSGCKLDFCPATTSVNLPLLQNLSLDNVFIPYPMNALPSLTRNSPLIKVLKLKECWGFVDLSVLIIPSLPNLEKLELEQCHGLKKLDIQQVLPKLQAFIYGGCISFGYAEPCEFIWGSSESTLRELILQDATITKESLQHQLCRKFLLLDKLVLCRCHDLRGIKIVNRRLKTLNLDQCDNLAKVVIKTPNLCSFTYEGNHKLPFPSVDTSSSNLENVEFRFQPKRKKFEAIDQYLWEIKTIWFGNLTDFLAKFNSAKYLQLVVQSTEMGCAIIYEKLSEILLPPFHDLEIKILKTTSLESLIDVPLSRHPKAISVMASSSSKLHEFLYKEIVQREEKLNCCCRRSEIKCWRHSLKASTVLDFAKGVEDDESDWYSWLKSSGLLNQTTTFNLHWA